MLWRALATIASGAASAWSLFPAPKLTFRSSFTVAIRTGSTRAATPMITYHIDRNAQRITCNVTIGMRVLDVAHFVEQLFADPAFNSNFDTLVIVDDDAAVPDIPARHALAELLTVWRGLHAPAKWALVLPGSAWRRLAGHVIEEHGLETQNVRCFPSSTLALEWFGRTDGSVPATPAERP